MSYITWAFSPQVHKSRNGYYINHDNLVLASPEERRKLIFYFIANQVPEKLDPQDAELYENHRFADVNYHTNMFNAAALAVLAYTSSKIP
mmetsp:Transcript_35368/g.31838  ORF Transcript_35368/g.31838 Transcript_35368/m.31838 type:complete len:90 (+) Transcript_35368:52-321(+)